CLRTLRHLDSFPTRRSSDLEIAESGQSQFAPLYPDDMKLFDKIDTIVKRIYRGSEAVADKSVRDQLHQWEQQGYGNLPVCMAKTDRKSTRLNSSHVKISYAV